MRVLHVITRMIKGGAQYNTLHTVVGLDAGRYECELATGLSTGVEGSLLDEARARVTVREVPELVREVSPARDLAALSRLAELMRRGRYDIVHTHTSKAGLLGRVAAVMARVPVIVHTPHGHVFHGYFPRVQTALYRWLERAAARWTDRVITLTACGAAEHVQAGIGPEELFVPIHSGVQVEAFARPSRGRAGVRADLSVPLDAPVVVSVGRLVPVKGHDVLVRAFAEVLRRHPGAVLLIVGEGPQRPVLEGLVDRLGLAGSVRLLGLQIGRAHV